MARGPTYRRSQTARDWEKGNKHSLVTTACFVEAAIAIELREINPEILLGRLRKRGTGTDSKFITYNN